MTKRIVNIINFIRGIDERGDFDLITPVRKEAELIRQYQFPATWLLQYDALVTGPYVDLLKENFVPGTEYGIWLEMDRYLAEAAQVEWKGRMTWDYHANCAFSMGYTQDERKRLCDAFVLKFKEVFGFPPKVMGCWCFDAFTLQYLHEKHGIIGACNCKDQQGTDGYTLRGGYFANAYYPSIYNAFIPANTIANQIPVPVFRMLGSDPLHQYDCPFEDQFQLVISLEPVYKHAGGSPEWVDYFFRETFTRPALAMAYAQVGQENSFPANQIFPALEMQFEKLKQLQNQKILNIETLGKSAEDFRHTHALTPATAVTTLQDYRDPAAQGVWYLCRNYRLNLYRSATGQLQIRSWALFDENFEERNHVVPLTDKSCVLESLPVWDSFSWHQTHFLQIGDNWKIDTVTEFDSETLEVHCSSSNNGQSIWRFTPDKIDILFSESPNPGLEMVLPETMDAEIIKIFNDKIILKYRNWVYGIKLLQGTIQQKNRVLIFTPRQSILSLTVSCN